jgi:hypothetical protein
LKHNIEPLSDLKIKQTNGGEGIIAYDPATGEPFPEENGAIRRSKPHKLR